MRSTATTARMSFARQISSVARTRGATSTRRLHRRNAILASVAFVLGLGSTLLAPPAFAQQKTDETDLQLPLNDPKVVELGKEKYAERCAFCHGGEGRGAKGPCLTCGKFPYSGNTNMGIYRTIAGGITNRSLGGTMGAFGTTMSQDEIIAVMTYLRSEEKRRIAAGEIPNPDATGSSQ
ncbi:MAG TPA: c-type cytochrome [Burkholderiales bacterium]|nr:c-type cytochrome [Burkholderiales bacterium]